jgi:hypothetical protein
LCVAKAPSRAAAGESWVIGVNEDGGSHEWIEESELTKGDLNFESLRSERTKPSRADRAFAFLCQILSNGRLPTEFVYNEAAKAGITIAAVKAARSEHRIRTKKLRYVEPVTGLKRVQNFMAQRDHAERPQVAG